VKCSKCQEEMECVGMDKSESMATTFYRRRNGKSDVPEFHWHDHRIYRTIFICPNCGRTKEIEYMETCPVPDCEWNQRELVKNLPKVSPKRALENRVHGEELS